MSSIADCSSAASAVPLPTVGAVILSMGTRPRELAAAMDSLLRQRGVDLDVVVVGNGWTPSGLPDHTHTVALAENVGVPEGRNIGARETRGDTIFFFDDDAILPSDDVLLRLVSTLWGRPNVALVQPRAIDPTGRPSPRRWVPRLRATEKTTGGPAVVFWEGVHVVRRAAFEAVGGWPGHFFYGHEGIDLAWRLIDAGWQIRYEPSIVVNHPATSPTRHAVYYRMNARNRVWVARRNLPLPLMPLYLGLWTAITLMRIRDPEALREWFSGFWEGVTSPAGERRPMRWSSVLTMTRLGRPPIV
jgi:GT2 family glycosyltransferase